MKPSFGLFLAYGKRLLVDLLFNGVLLALGQVKLIQLFEKDLYNLALKVRGFSQQVCIFILYKYV